MNVSNVGRWVHRNGLNNVNIIYQFDPPQNNFPVGNTNVSKSTRTFQRSMIIPNSYQLEPPGVRDPGSINNKNSLWKVSVNDIEWCIAIGFITDRDLLLDSEYGTIMMESWGELDHLKLIPQSWGQLKINTFVYDFKMWFVTSTWTN